ncbi:hypothetical protein E4U53_000708, partial [Claviceps sorghi]
PGLKTEIDIFAHLINGRHYSGCCEGDAVPSKMIPFLMGEYAKGNYPLDKIVSFYDFNDFQAALDDTKRGATLKAVLVWKENLDAQQLRLGGTTTSTPGEYGSSSADNSSNALLELTYTCPTRKQADYCTPLLRNSK